MALKPEYLQGLPDELAALTENLEAQLIGDIARRIAKAGEITDTAAYQIMRLKEMGASTEYIEKLLADYLKTSDKAIERMIFDAAQTDSEFYESVYARAGRAYVPFEHNAYLQQLADAAVNQTKGELKNLTQSMGFAVRGANGQLTFLPAAKAYQSAMDKAHMLVASGGMDYTTAVRMSVNDIAASGLRFVDYESGVRNHADVAARRAILTGVSQMTGKISERNAAELGTDVVEVTAHAGARPDHAVWQGKWFSLKGKDKHYPKLSTATGYGTVTGLKGANCRHDFYPVIPGIDQPAYTAEQLANIDPPPVTVNGRTYTYYEAEQRQREMERTIRKTKREIIAAEASGDNDQFTAKSVLLRRQREQYSEFSKAAGLLTRNERTQVAEFGRSAGSKSSWAARKAQSVSGGAAVTGGNSGGNSQNNPNSGLTSGGGSGMIKVTEEHNYHYLSKDEFDKIGFSQITPQEHQQAYSHRVFDDKGNYIQEGGYIRTCNSFSINKALRTDNISSLSDDDKLTISTLESIMDNNPSKIDMLVDRYTDPNYIRQNFGIELKRFNTQSTNSCMQEILSDHINDIIEEKGFTSASWNPDENVFKDSRPVQLVISIPKGTPMYVTDNNDESEIILKRGTKFKVTNCDTTKNDDDDDLLRIFLEVIKE